MKGEMRIRKIIDKLQDKHDGKSVDEAVALVEELVGLIEELTEEIKDVRQNFDDYKKYGRCYDE